MSATIEPLSAGLASAPARVAGRKLFIDNLRWSMIVLVISMHAAVTYSPFGSWYWRDNALTSRAETIVLATYQSFLQSFFMGLLFAVAGYFARASLARKGARSFIADRAFRLGLPTLLFALVIGPVTQFYAAGSWHAGPDASFALEWWRHIANGEVLSNTGPLWFCVALLIFSIVYAATGVPAPSRPDGAAIAPGPLAVLLFMAAMGVSTFLMRLVVPGGHAVLNMQLGDFPGYILMFIAGIHASKTGWPDRISARAGTSWGLAGIGLGLIAWFALITLGGNHGADYAGGLRWQALAKSFWEAFAGTSLSLALVTLYRDRFDGETRLSRFLSANAFAVYVIHPPILILITRALHFWPEPNLVKFQVATVLGTVATFAAAALVRAVPGVKSVL
jgi:fucose 4-O-acetylase-like acetyltransferase